MATNISNMSIGISVDASQAEDQLFKLGKQVADFGKSVKKTADSVKGFALPVLEFVGATSVATAALVKLSAAGKAMGDQLGLVFGDFRKGAAALDVLKGVSVSTGAGLDDLSQGVQTLTRAGFGLGKSLDIIGKAGGLDAILGGSGIKEITESLAKLNSNADATAEVFDGLKAKGLDPYKQLSKDLRVSTDQAARLVRQGMVSGFDGAKAVEEMLNGPEAKEAIEKFRNSLEGKLAIAGKTWVESFRSVGDALVEGLPVDQIVAAITGAGQGLEDSAKAAREYFRDIFGDGDFQSIVEQSRKMMIDFVSSALKVLGSMADYIGQLAGSKLSKLLTGEIGPISAVAESVIPGFETFNKGSDRIVPWEQKGWWGAWREDFKKFESGGDFVGKNLKALGKELTQTGENIAAAGRMPHQIAGPGKVLNRAKEESEQLAHNLMALTKSIEGNTLTETEKLIQSITRLNMRFSDAVGLGDKGNFAKDTIDKERKRLSRGFLDSTGNEFEKIIAGYQKLEEDLKLIDKMPDQFGKGVLREGKIRQIDEFKESLASGGLSQIEGINKTFGDMNHAMAMAFVTLSGDGAKAFNDNLLKRQEKLLVDFESGTLSPYEDFIRKNKEIIKGLEDAANNVDPAAAQRLAESLKRQKDQLRETMLDSSRTDFEKFGIDRRKLEKELGLAQGRNDLEMVDHFERKLGALFSHVADSLPSIGDSFFAPTAEVGSVDAYRAEMRAKFGDQTMSLQERMASAQERMERLAKQQLDQGQDLIRIMANQPRAGMLEQAGA